MKNRWRAVRESSSSLMGKFDDQVPLGRSRDPTKPTTELDEVITREENIASFLANRIPTIPKKNAKTTSPSSTTDAQFTLFPRLPPELRLAIYKLYLPPSKLVNIHTTNRKSECDAWWPEADPTPPIFYTCHEARDVILKSHKLFLGWNEHPDVWVNCKIDTVCFSANYCTTPFGIFIASLPPDTQAAIKQLYLAEFCKTEREKEFRSFKSGFSNLTGLKQLLVGPAVVSMQGELRPVGGFCDPENWLPKYFTDTEYCCCSNTEGFHIKIESCIARVADRVVEEISSGIVGLEVRFVGLYTEPRFGTRMRGQ